MKLVIAAGGTGGHIFPALAVARALRERIRDVSLLWIGTSRSRERELCEKNGIRLRVIDVTGLRGKADIKAARALWSFVREVARLRAFFGGNRYDAVLAFGGYVSAPVLTAARMCSIPYFLHEQNTVMGKVNRFFARRAECTFLSFPLAAGPGRSITTLLTGMPVKKNNSTYDSFHYPQGFDRSKKCVLISGGSQGAASMNRCLIEPVKRLLAEDIQVVWQTGTPTFEEVRAAMARFANAFVFDSLDDLYPYYAAAKLVVCRAGSSTLNEAAYFGLPCVMIPLPWSADNHQWMNAGLVEGQGWGVRVAQDNGCGTAVVESVRKLLADSAAYERLCRRALDHNPENAAEKIVTAIIDMLGINNAPVS